MQGVTSGRGDQIASRMTGLGRKASGTFSILFWQPSNRLNSFFNIRIKCIRKDITASCCSLFYCSPNNSFFFISYLFFLLFFFFFFFLLCLIFFLFFL